jgi:hypothetical protein
VNRWLDHGTARVAAEFARRARSVLPEPWLLSICTRAAGTVPR